MSTTLPGLQSVRVGIRVLTGLHGYRINHYSKIQCLGCCEIADLDSDIEVFLSARVKIKIITTRSIRVNKGLKHT